MIRHMVDHESSFEFFHLNVDRLFVIFDKPISPICFHTMWFKSIYPEVDGFVWL